MSLLPAMSRVPSAHSHRAARRLSLLILVGLVVCAILPATGAASGFGRPTAQGSGQHRGSWLVNFKPSVSVGAADDSLRAAGAIEIGRLDDLGTRVINLPFSRPAAALRRLAEDPRVASVEPDETAQATVVPNDPRWSKAWGPRRIRAPEAWNLTKGNGGTIIAIVDTGVDPRHPELRGRLVDGYDFQNNDARPRDDNGHGTAVANVAAAGGNDRVGMTGVCWRCKIMPVKVLNANGSGSHSNIAAGIVWAAKHGADVINLSLASSRPTKVVGNAVAYARRHGVIVIAAAGNEGSRKRYFPAAYPGVISVAATNGSDTLYPWSNRGTWVKLSAPGCAYTGKPGPAWSWWCGTSFATPAVAGVAALIKSARPRISRADLERTLLNSTVRVRGVSNGRIDAAKAVRKAVAAIGGNLGPNPTATPKATPKPSERPSYSWRGDLSADDHLDRKSVYLAGRNNVSLGWSNHVSVSLRVTNWKGREVMSFRDDDGFREAQFWAEAGWYEVMVSQSSDRNTDYHVRVN